MRLLITVFMFGLVSANATTWYVDNTATGAQNGTSWANAWTSLSQVSGVSPGDTIYISGGPNGSSRTYNISNWIPNNSGTSGNPITYTVGQDPQHNGMVIFDGSGSQSSFWMAQSGNARNWITINGDVNGQNHITLQNYPADAIYADGCDGLVIRHVNFINQRYRNNGGSPQEISYCYFNITNLDHCIYSGGGALLAHNDVFMASRASAPVHSAAQGDDCIQSPGSGTAIYSNIFIGFVIANYTAGQHQDGVQTWTSNLKIYDNYFFNMGNSATFIAPYTQATDLSNVWIYNNVAECCGEGFCLGNNNAGQTANFHNCIIANNVLADSFDIQYPNLVGTGVNNWYSDDIVANNIWINSGGANLSSSITVENNVLATSPSSVAGYFVAYTAATSASTISTNDYDFHLTANAVSLIGQGANLSSYFTADKDGNPRPAASAWDIGPYQYQSGSSSNPPSIVNQPVGVTNNTVNGFTLSVGASGTPPLTYNWYFGANRVQSGNSSSYSPATPVSTNLSGSYKVVITNLYGAVTSSTAAVLITNAVTNCVPLSFGVTNAYGTVSSPFTITGNYLSQSVTTTDPTQGGQAVYWFNVTNAGNYVILATVNCPSDAANSFFVNIDGYPTASDIWDINPSGTGWTNVYVSWRGANTDTNDQYSPMVFSNLTVGIHELILVGREAGAQVSWLMVTNYSGQIFMPTNPAIQVTPGSVAFGTILSGTSAGGSFTVKNNGGGTLSGTASVSAPFSIVSGANYNLASNQSQTVTVSFNPTSAGSYSQNVSLTGGGGAIVSLTGSATNVPVNPAIQVSPGSVAFGTILSGTSKMGSFTVKNVGNGTLSGAASVSAPFSIVSGANYNLTANQSETVAVAFNPTSSGNYSQNVTLTGGGGARVGVSGSATNAPVLPTVSAISVDATDVDLNLQGLQIYSGTKVQFAATAANAQTWQWSYSVNGGTPVVYRSGTGAVTNVSYYFDTNSAGNSYLWILVVSNSTAWAESQTNLLVETAPGSGGTVTTNTIPGPVVAATSGSLSGLLTGSTTINGVPTGYFYQPLPSLGSTSGGTAVYNVTITNAGEYEIQAWVYAPNTSANSLLVNIDSKPQSPTMIWDIMPVTSGFEQRLVCWRGNGTESSDQIVPKIFNLSVGQHQITFMGREPGTAMASFRLLQVVTTVQSPPSAPSGLRVISSSP